MASPSVCSDLGMTFVDISGGGRLQQRSVSGLIADVPSNAWLRSMTVEYSGWVDLRPRNWEKWKERIQAVVRDRRENPGVEKGSRTDQDYGDSKESLRPGRLAAWVFTPGSLLQGS